MIYASLTPVEHFTYTQASSQTCTRETLTVSISLSLKHPRSVVILELREFWPVGREGERQLSLNRLYNDPQGMDLFHFCEALLGKK